jgi:Mlc titration factor MtfA (ptsG expression regulator)
MGWLARWRRAGILKRTVLEEGVWRDAVGRYAFVKGLADNEQRRLRELAILFLHEKSIHGAGGLAVRDEIRISIAAQACILILNLDLDYYRGWFEVIVYPDEFVAQYEYMDEDGIVHQVAEPMTGESWLQGPVILSWADAKGAADLTGYNVVIHEFAHKLDMLNGDANGFPPLHVGMSRDAWSRAFTTAYADFCGRIERREETPIDPYAAENPGEFFAVTSEAFFEIPQALQGCYPEVYRQLALFYRQDPALRMGQTAQLRPSGSPARVRTRG